MRTACADSASRFFAVSFIGNSLHVEASLQKLPFLARKLWAPRGSKTDTTTAERHKTTSSSRASFRKATTNKQSPSFSKYFSVIWWWIILCTGKTKFVDSAAWLPGCCSQTFSSTRHLFLSPFSCCCPMGLELRDRTAVAAERDLMGISKSLENPQKLPFWSRVVVLGLFWPFLPPKKKRVGIESAAAAVGVLEWSWAASSFDRFSKAISSIGKRSSYTNALSLSVGSKGINCNETLSIYRWDHHRQEMKLIFQRAKKKCR